MDSPKLKPAHVRTVYVVASREAPVYPWDAPIGERVFAHAVDAEWYRANLVATAPDLADRLGIFEAYLIVTPREDAEG